MFVILRHPWFFPLVDPSTLGRKTLYELASLVHCYIAPSLPLSIKSSCNASVLCGDISSSGSGRG